jgi:signal transduction histidine kinase
MSAELRALAPVLERIAAGAAHVTVAIAGALPQVDLSAEALERIAVNLVRNAAEAIRNSRPNTGGECEPELPGHIRVSLDAVAGTVRLTVEDDGPGMPPAVAAAFLQPGPLPTGAMRGLGHRIVHELAGATGARLSIRVRPGRGTAFCLRWPLADESDVSAALEPMHRAASRITRSGGLSPC